MGKRVNNPISPRSIDGWNVGCCTIILCLDHRWFFLELVSMTRSLSYSAVSYYRRISLNAGVDLLCYVQGLASTLLLIFAHVVAIIICTTINLAHEIMAIADKTPTVTTQSFITH